MTDTARLTTETVEGIGRVLADVHEERVRQLDRWGVQHRHDDTGGDTLRAEAEQAKRICQAMEKHVDGGAGWRVVLAEEVAEVFAERDPAPLRAELVQVAAVAVAWIEDLDAREGAQMDTAAGISPLVDELRRLRATRDAARALADAVEACYPPNIADGYDMCTCGAASAWPCQTTRLVWAVTGVDADAEIKRVCDAAAAAAWLANGPYPDEYADRP